MTGYYSFNTFRNSETNINTHMPTAPTHAHHRLHKSIQMRNRRNLLRRGVTSNINHIYYKKPSTGNNR